MSDGEEIRAAAIADRLRENEPAVFTTVREYDVGRPCEHTRFVLDEKWMTVTCGICKERVDPFAALMSYARWGAALERKRASADEATRRMTVANLRRLRNLRHATPDEVQEIGRLLAGSTTTKLEDLMEASQRIERTVSVRRQDRALATGGL